MKSTQLRKDFFFSNKLYNDIKNLIFNRTNNSIRIKREYYNYAILFKSTKRFYW